MNEIYLYGEVGRDFTAQGLTGLTGDLEVHINSAGGNVYDGLAIYNLLKRQNSVGIVIDGICASAASVIACAGHVKMVENGIYMVHLPLAGLEGYFNSQDLEEVQKSLRAVKDAVIATYRMKTGQSEEELAKMIERENWLSAQEAKELGFVDEVINGGQVKMGNEVMSKYKESVLAAERARIKRLTGLKSGVVEMDAVIDAAIEQGAEEGTVKVYLEAIKRARGKASATGFEELKALIRDNMRSGSEGVESSADVTAGKEMQAEMISRYANEITGAKR